MSQRKFHHGNLRAALLELAQSELERRGYEALLLRDLAVTLGVSSAAPYRHFENKGALFTALGTIGAEQLYAIYQDALNMDADPSIRLRAACQGYLDFAKARPELFRLMFISTADWHLAASDVVIGPSSAFALFHQLVSDNLGRPRDQDTLGDALMTWSIIHGFAALRLNGRLAVYTKIPDLGAVEAAVLDRACAPSTRT